MMVYYRENYIKRTFKYIKNKQYHTSRYSRRLSHIDHLIISICRFLRSFILAASTAHVILLDLITLTVLGDRYNYEFPQYEAFSSRHSYPFWTRIFTSLSLACVPPLMQDTMFHNHIPQRARLFLYFLNFQILPQKSRRQRLHWKITPISCFKFTSYFHSNIILICQ